MVKLGIGASPGIALAKALVYQKTTVQTEKKASEPECEKKRLTAALNTSKGQLESIVEKALQELGEEEAAIFEAHKMILEDPELIGGIEADIDAERCNAEWSVQQVVDQFVAMFESMDDPYFAARAADMRDVGNRILHNLTGTKIIDLSALSEDVILIAQDLAPSDTAMMDKKHVLGFVTEIGSPTSHTAIMARSLEIPAVLGLKDVTSAVSDGTMVIVDGTEGHIVIAPSPEETETYRQKQRAYENLQKELAALQFLPAETLDGHPVTLAGNIGKPEDVEGVINHGGEGVGLYRTEFLYMNCDTMPDEEKQFEAYKKVAEAFPDSPVIIRTMDIGGDKKLPYLPMEEEMNPFLGLRAIRLCFTREDLFKTQLRAILRASVFGKIFIMFPMISGIQELRRAKLLVQACMKELDQEGQAYDSTIQIGIMVEVPSAAITADLLVKEASFFSIGSNDLCQYTMAVDRMNQNVAYLYDALNPAILRLVKNVIDASHCMSDRFTGMCGEMAGDPKAALILLGLGLDEFSMSAGSIPQIKKIIRSVRYEDAKQIAEQALQLETGEEVAALAEEALKKIGCN